MTYIHTYIHIMLPEARTEYFPAPSVSLFLPACMCEYMYVHTFRCFCLHHGMCECMYVYMYVCCAYSCVCMCVCMYVCVNLCMFMCICMYVVRMHAYIFVFQGRIQKKTTHELSVYASLNIFVSLQMYTLHNSSCPCFARTNSL